MVPVWGCGGLGCSSPSLVVSSEGMRGVGDLGLWGGDGGKQRGCGDRPWMGGCLGCACPEGGEGAGRGLGQRQTDRHEDRMGSEKITQTPPSPHPPVLLTTSPCVTSPQFSAPPGTVTPPLPPHAPPWRLRQRLTSQCSYIQPSQSGDRDGDSGRGVGGTAETVRMGEETWGGKRAEQEGDSGSEDRMGTCGQWLRPSRTREQNRGRPSVPINSNGAVGHWGASGKATCPAIIPRASW